MRPGKAVTAKLSAGNSTSTRPRFVMSEGSWAFLASRICARDQGGRGAILVLCDGLVTVFAPMGLDEHAVDLFEIDDAGLIADGLDERRHTEVFSSAQKPFAGAHDESERIGGEGVVAQPGVVEFAQNKRFDRFGREAWQDSRSLSI